MRTGLKIGYVDDIEMDTQGANIVSLIVYGKPRAFGIMGRDEDIIIKCSDIELIGEDTILVKFNDSAVCTKSRILKQFARTGFCRWSCRKTGESK